jgi:hypothetical protein
MPRPIVAQEPGAMGGPRRFQVLADHWMTIDSLAEAVGLTADQKAKVTQPYTALNGVMHDAAATGDVRCAPEAPAHPPPAQHRAGYLITSSTRSDR